MRREAGTDELVAVTREFARNNPEGTIVDFLTEVGMEAVAKYSQISRSSLSGSSRTSALSVARPARPTCW